MKNTESKIQKFSFFKSPVTQVTKPYRHITLNNVYQLLTGNFYRKQTFELRAISDKQQNRDFKAASFPFVTFSGTFSERRKEKLKHHSGLMVLDFDHLNDIEMVKYQLLKDKYLETQLLFTSPNGNGLKWIIPVNINGEYNHGQWFDAISNYIRYTYKIEVDKSGRDVVRVCFLCFDPDAYLNPKYGKMNRLWPGEIYTNERKKFNPGKWLNETNRRKDFKPVPFSANMTRIQRDVETVIRRIENCQIDLTLSYDDWKNIGFAFIDSFGESGRDYFHRVSQFHPEYNPINCNWHFDQWLKHDNSYNKSKIKIGSFFQVAKDAGINIRV